MVVSRSKYVRRSCTTYCSRREGCSRVRERDKEVVERRPYVQQYVRHSKCSHHNIIQVLVLLVIIPGNATGGAIRRIQRETILLSLVLLATPPHAQGSALFLLHFLHAFFILRSSFFSFSSVVAMKSYKTIV
jgi:hypothetical protein